MPTEIRQVEPEEIFKYWEEVSHSEILKVHTVKELAWGFGKVASGELLGVGFFEEGDFKGLVILESLQVPMDGGVGWYAKTVQIYAPGNGRRFVPEFEGWLRGRGYRKVGGATKREGEGMSRLFGYEKLYTYYEKEL